MLLYVKENYGNPTIYITENGKFQQTYRSYSFSACVQTNTTV